MCRFFTLQHSFPAWVHWECCSYGKSPSPIFEFLRADVNFECRFRWRTNYVWLLNRIFLPGCLNSLAGLIATFVNVYSQQNGKWSVTAWITATVTGGCMLITGCLFALYNFWILEKVKKKHGIDMERATGGHDGEGLAEKIERYGFSDSRRVHSPAWFIITWIIVSHLTYQLSMSRN